MKSIENEDHPEKPVHLEKVTQAEVLNILWLSFLFSQGTKSAQENILKLIRSYSVAPAEINIPEASQAFCKQISNKNAIGSRTSLKLADNAGHKKISSSTITDELFDVPTYLGYLAVTNREEETPTEIIQIIDDIWNSDFNFLIKNEGRPDRLEEHIGDNTIKDKFFSLGVHYLLRDTNTSNPIFNILLAEMRAVPFSEYEATSLEYMIDIIETYNNYHPDTQVDQEIFTRIQEALVQNRNTDN